MRKHERLISVVIGKQASAQNRLDLNEHCTVRQWPGAKTGGRARHRRMVADIIRGQGTGVNTSVINSFQGARRESYPPHRTVLSRRKGWEG